MKRYGLLLLLAALPLLGQSAPNPQFEQGKAALRAADSSGWDSVPVTLMVKTPLVLLSILALMMLTRRKGTRRPGAARHSHLKHDGAA